MWLNQRRGHAGREVEASAPERGHRCVLRRAGSFGIKHVKSRAAHRHLATPAVGSTNRLSDMPLFDKMRSSMMHRLLFLTVLAWVLVISPRAAHAGDTLNVQDWLSQPGVRLVAVEFYATWCKPCMEAMPRWKKLKEKYASQGLRVVVVNTQDPDGGCRSLPFVPDETVCDLDGYISDGFGLQGKLPSAFLWSWQGNLLVSKGHIDEVEHAVEAYLKDAPRVVIEAAADVPADAAAGVRERLTDDGKVLVLAGAAEQAALAAARRAQQSAQYDEKLTCKIGMEVPPNALLKVSRVAQGKSAFLNVGLYDLTGGCLLASASSELNGPGKQVAQDAASKLLRKLKRPDGLQQPASGVPRGSSSSKARADKVVNPEDRGWKPTTDDPSRVIFESTPQGARVEVDGNVLCEKTPCNKMLPPGQPVIRMSMAKYVAKEERVKVDAEQRLSWTLERNTAQVTVETGVSGVPIVIDDEPSGESPVTVELAAGAHRIEIKDRCFEPARADVGIVRGVAKTVTLKGLAKTSGLRVELSAADGDPAEGDVMLDGQLVGRTWKTLQVSSCGTRVEVKSPASGVPRGSSSSKARADKVVNPEDRGWKPTTDDPSLVIFESTPKGARVEVDGNVLCEKTPCKKMLPPGQPVIRMSMAKYVAKEERVKVDAEQRLSWTLERNTAQVTDEQMWSREVKLTPYETTRLEGELNEATTDDPSRVIFESTPKGARVEVDGNVLEASPQTEDRIGIVDWLKAKPAAIATLSVGGGLGLLGTIGFGVVAGEAKGKAGDLTDLILMQTQHPSDPNGQLPANYYDSNGTATPCGGTSDATTAHPYYRDACDALRSQLKAYDVDMALMATSLVVMTLSVGGTYIWYYLDNDPKSDAKPANQTPHAFVTVAPILSTQQQGLSFVGTF